MLVVRASAKDQSVPLRMGRQEMPLRRLVLIPQGSHLKLSPVPLPQARDERALGQPALGTWHDGGMGVGQSVTVIVPAYNEEERISAGLERIISALLSSDLAARDLELIVVDDGSGDETALKARAFVSPIIPLRVISLSKNSGKGAAIRAGLAQARGALSCFIDADASIDPRHLSDIVQALESSPIAIGDRASDGHRIEYHSPVRSAMGRIFNRLVRLLSGVHIVDTQCGCKGFTTAAGRLLFALGSIDGFAFDVELLRTAQGLGLGVSSVPVSWKDMSGSHVRRIHDPAVMVFDLFRSRMGEGRRSVPAVQIREDVLVEPGPWIEIVTKHARYLTLAGKGDAEQELAAFGSLMPLSLHRLAREGLERLTLKA